MGSFISKIFHYKKIVSAKRSSTLSGALVYFTLLELVPLAYLTTLTLSMFGAKFSNPINNLMTRDMNMVVDYIFVTANNLGASGNVFAVLISTYSATHFFFHLRTFPDYSSLIILPDYLPFVSAVLLCENELFYNTVTV